MERSGPLLRLPPPSRAAAAAARVLDAWRCPAVAALAVAALSSQTPPTARGFADPDSYVSAWSLRIGPANLVELLLLLSLGLGLLRHGFDRTRRLRLGRLDAPVGAAVLLLAGLQAVALIRGLPAARFLAFDLERLLLPLLVYAVASRMPRDRGEVRLICALAGTLLGVHAVQLVITHGLLGSTEFGTAAGRTALLITEDTLLMLLPVLLLWGLAIDGLVGWRRRIAAVAAAVAALAVDLVSLRRGASAMLAGTLAVRALPLGRRRLLALAGVLAALGAAGWLAGPLRPVAQDAAYAVGSLVGVNEDASTRQRSGELRSFGRNVDGLDWMLGRGFGTTWAVDHVEEVELGSFGSGETAFDRIGWHFPGLDWAYKVGALGLLALLAVLLAVARAARAVRRHGTPHDGSLAVSLAVAHFPLGLFALTNLRLAAFAALCMGLLSRLADLSGSPPRTSEASRAPSAAR